MTGEWKECKLGDVCEQVLTGGTPLTKKSDYYLNGKIPWLKTKEVNFCRINKTENYISELGLANSAAKLIPANSVIVAMYGQGDTAGRVAINKIPLATNQACCNLVIDNKIADYHFIYYLLKNSYFELVLRKTGSAQPNLNTKLLKDFDILLPPLPEQFTIASILSSLDDKIDLLHRQNKTLEAMAETLFRQWFVEEADEGWKEKPLSFYGTIICGKTPSKKVQSYFNGDIPFIKIPDMHGNIFLFDTSDSLTEEGKRSQSNKTLPPKSICVSCIATVGLVSLNAKESQTNQQINSIVPNENYYRYYLYLTMRSSYDLLHSMASGGTATLNLNTGNFSQIPVLYPEQSVLEEFHSEVEPLFDKIFFNQSQIHTLEKLRDTLLPKLMSGEVRVELAQGEAAR
ncbi:restriction endonuclease subunit S [Methanosarcina mazei]|uniref:Type I restriction modification DNA specificity domain-containing protein n=3 Tax=Methanosarcina mazei TaxID=2209 RepID=A0A0F8H6H4_METMZ|nr:restriction endonuclease subunit S [Methanosarcina mazei]AKB41434.1 Type I restriction-modification system, specificity subunit S [Methanosarcina mazei WWM610]AKB71843.1 Type I restriction-modification system, specificity subunit S [Methanosarcina mazei C16]KKG07428.1 hypothetical protein DU34_07645 [Methanosarcina mazei]KKG32551.1 hypothetical protein DU49_14615 [Methanosarcina mazei]KKG36049.1 hypothetical protein DU35_07045 [Methanosarcina mazei]